MKQLHTLLVILCIAPSVIFAQPNVNVLEKSVVMSAGTKNGFQITIEEAGTKEITKALKSWLTEQQDKLDIDDVSKTELKVTGIIVPTIGESPINIYFVIAAVKDNVTVTGFFEMPGGFLSSATAPVKYKDGENFMRRFALRVQKNRITETYNDAQKDLTRSEDDQKDLEKKNTSLNSDIADYQKRIEQAKKDLEENAKEQEAKKKEISDRQRILDDITSQLKLYDGY